VSQVLFLISLNHVVRQAVPTALSTLELQTRPLETRHESAGVENWLKVTDGCQEARLMHCSIFPLSLVQ
jgi:hypothetical protein